MPNYRSLIGGFFSSTPMDKSTGPVSIRCNNPGAINGASWEQSYPGYVDTVLTTPGNRSTIFEAPEYGMGAWWDLLRRYRAAGATTVEGIITRYGGGQDYSAYLQFVLKQTGFSPGTVIDLNNDQQLVQFGRAMFRYEAGRALPWNDDQLLCGIRGGRTFASTNAWPATTALGPQLGPQPQPTPTPGGPMAGHDLLPVLQKLLAALAAKPSAPVVNPGGAPVTPSTPGTVPTPLSFIDKIFGGQALVGSKTTLGVISYVIVAILKAVGVLGVATPPGQIMTILSIALTVLGALAKVDRATQSIANVAAASK
jgi:hypothetical protein